jgi:hypothetical protein
MTAAAQRAPGQGQAAAAVEEEPEEPEVKLEGQGESWEEGRGARMLSFLHPC